MLNTKEIMEQIKAFWVMADDEVARKVMKDESTVKVESRVMNVSSEPFILPKSRIRGLYATIDDLSPTSAGYQTHAINTEFRACRIVVE